MSRIGSRKAWLGLAAVGVTMALSSAAFACVSYTGTMRVTGSGGAGESVNIGNGRGMTFCPGYPKGKAKASSGGSVNVSMSKSPLDSCGLGTRLKAGTYVVGFLKTGAFTRSDVTDTSNKDGSRVRKGNCNSGATPLGTMTIDAAGKGSGTYTLPSDVGPKSGPTDEAAVCVMDFFTQGNSGNMTPLSII